MSPAPEYKVELDAFSGPLDLLLYLIRREEVDIWNIPIGRITEQYLRHLELMSELNINVAGEFLVMAATLMEIKSRLMSPDPEPMPEEEPEDPRMELVRQLMEYKRFKEAAVALAERAEAQAGRFAPAGQRPPDAAQRAPGVGGVTVWALMEAFSRLLEQTGARGPHKIVLDSLPQEVLQAQLEERVRQAGRITFAQVFDGPITRARLCGMFLALLELVRLQVLRAEQEKPFGDIWISYIPPEERQNAMEPPPAQAPAPAEEMPAPSQLAESQEEEFEDLPDDDQIELPEVPEVDAPDLPKIAGAVRDANEEEEPKQTENSRPAP